MESTKQQRRKYSQQDLESALKAIKNGESIGKASQRYGVPKATLHAKFCGRRPEGFLRMGPIPFLTDAEEEQIVQWCFKLAKCGFPLKQHEILNTVQQFIRADGRQTPFKDDRPGRKWYAAFLRRNPQLVERTSEGVTKGRAIVTEQFIRKWFDDLESYLKEIDAFQVLQHPERVFNGDETSFSMCPKTGKVLAPKGYKNIYTINMGNEKDTLTVLLVFSAAGKTVPPMIVFPYKRTPAEIVNSMQDVVIDKFCSFVYSLIYFY